MASQNYIEFMRMLEEVFKPQPYRSPQWINYAPVQQKITPVEASKLYSSMIGSRDILSSMPKAGAPAPTVVGSPMKPSTTNYVTPNAIQPRSVVSQPFGGMVGSRDILSGMPQFNAPAPTKVASPGDLKWDYGVSGSKMPVGGTNNLPVKTVNPSNYSAQIVNNFEQNNSASPSNVPSWGSVMGKSFAAGLPDTAASTVNALVRMPIQGINRALGADPDAGLSGIAKKYVVGQESLAQKTVDSIGRMTPGQEVLSGGARAIPNVLTSALMGGGVSAGGKMLGNAALQAGKSLPVAGAANKAGMELARMLPFGVSAAGSYAREAEMEGASYTQQLMYGAAGALAEMGTELPVVSGVLSLAGKLKDVPGVEKGAKNALKLYGGAAVELIKNIGKETLQEAVISPIAGTAKKAIYQPNMPIYGEGGVVDPGQMVDDAKTGAAMSVILTAIGLPTYTMAHVRAAKLMKEGRAPRHDEVEQISQDIKNGTQATEQDVADISQMQSINSQITGNQVDSGVDQNTAPSQPVANQPMPQAPSQSMPSAPIAPTAPTTPIAPTAPITPMGTGQQVNPTANPHQILVNAVTSKLNPQARQSYDNVVNSYVQQGMAQEQAEVRAIEGLEKTVEGKEIIEQAIPEATAEVQRVQAQAQAQMAMMQPAEQGQVPIQAPAADPAIMASQPIAADPAIEASQPMATDPAQMASQPMAVDPTIEAPEPLSPPDHFNDGIIPGDKYTLRNFGEVEVVDVSDPAKLIVRNSVGSNIPIGRTAFNNLLQDQTQSQSVTVEPQKSDAQISPVGGEKEQGNANISDQGDKGVKGAISDSDRVVGKEGAQSDAKPAQAADSEPKTLPEETDNIRIVDGEVFYKDNNATTAKRGYAWFTNKKSRFDKQRKSTILPERLGAKNIEINDQVEYNEGKSTAKTEAGGENVSGIQRRDANTVQEAISRLEQRVRQRVGGNVPQRTRVYEVVTNEAQGATRGKKGKSAQKGQIERDVEAARQIADLFGHEFVYIRVNPKLKSNRKLYDEANKFNGANVDGVIVLNADRTNPAHAVTGHEIVHEIAKDPELYDEFISTVKHITSEEGHAAVEGMIDLYKDSGMDITENQAWEEFAADMIGEQMTQKSFWEKLAKRSPNVVRKAIETIRKIVASLKKKVDAGNSVSQFIKDLEMAEEAALWATSRYLDKTVQQRAESALTESDKQFLQQIRDRMTTVAVVMDITQDNYNKKVDEMVGWMEKEIGDNTVLKYFSTYDPDAVAGHDTKWHKGGSTHAKWYRDFWAMHNKRPNKAEMREIAEGFLRSGIAAEESYMGAGQDIPADAEFLELEAYLNELQRIDGLLTKGFEEAEAGSGKESGTGTDGKVSDLANVEGSAGMGGSRAEIRFSAKRGGTDGKTKGETKANEELNVKEQLFFGFDREAKKITKQLEFRFPETKGREATSNAAKAIVEIQYQQQQQEKESNVSSQPGRSVDRNRKHSPNRVKTVARGYTKKMLNKGGVSFVGEKIKNPEELAVMAQILRDPRFETFRIFFTRTLQNGSKEIVWHTGVTSRIPGISSVSVGKDAKERSKWINDTFQEGFDRNADGYFFMHNHPSGDPKPSPQDFRVSKHFYENIKGLKYEGHVIINSNKYAYMDGQDALTEKYTIHDIPNAKEDALLAPDKPHDLLGTIPVDANGRVSPDSMLKMIQQYKSPEGYSVLFYFTPKFKVKGIQEVPSTNFKDEKKFQNWLRGQALDFGGQRVILAAENDDVYNFSKEMIRKNYFTDVIKMSTGMSAQNSGISSGSGDIWMGKEGKGIETWENRVRYQGEKQGNADVRFQLKRDESLTNDLIEEIRGAGGKVSSDGLVTVYHRTSKTNAEKIIKTGRMMGKEDGLFFSTAKEGYAEGYGDTAIEFRIPAEALEMDDLFDNEAHLKIPMPGKTRLLKVGQWIVGSRKASENRPSYQLKPGAKGGWAAARERGFSRNVRTDENMHPEIRKMFEDDPLLYSQLSNKETLAKAQRIFSWGYEEALTEWHRNVGSLRSEDVPLARMLANEAITREDRGMARQIIADLAEKLTLAGRFIQASKILRKADPQSVIMTFGKMLDKLNKQGREHYGKKWEDIVLTDEELKKIRDSKDMDEAGREELFSEIGANIASRLPVSGWEKWDAWRRIAMLTNPKTHLRNIFGNVIMRGMETSADKIAAGLEAAAVKSGKMKQESRTKAIGWRKDKALVEIVEKDWDAVKKDLGRIGKYEIESGLRGLRSLNYEKPIYKTKWLEKLNRFSMDTLNLEDVIFMRVAYKDALGQFMKARGLKEVTVEARKYAERRSLQATYKEANKLASLIQGYKASGSLGGKLLDAAFPFTKTPLNLVARALDYSPVGLLRVLFSTKRPPEEIIEMFSKGLTGTGIVLLGYLLAAWGWARGDDDNKRKGEELTKLSGDHPYSIITPWGSYKLDWAQPFSVPFFMGVVAKEKMEKQDEFSLETVFDSIAAGGDTIFELSMLQGLKDFTGYGSTTGNIMGLPIDYVKQGIPTILRQVAYTTDTTKRSGFGADDYDRLQREVFMQIPGVSRMLEPRLDILGRKQKQGNWFQQFFNPGLWTKRSEDPVVVELQRLYDSMGTADMIPKLAPYDFSYDKKEYKLAPKEVTAWQEAMGQMNYEAIYSAIHHSGYADLDDQERVKGIAGIVNKNYNMVKDAYLDYKGVERKKEK